MNNWKEKQVKNNADGCRNEKEREEERLTADSVLRCSILVTTLVPSLRHTYIPEIYTHLRRAIRRGRGTWIQFQSRCDACHNYKRL